MNMIAAVLAVSTWVPSGGSLPWFNPGGSHSGTDRQVYISPPPARETEPGPNWIVDYYHHVNDWAVRNRDAIIQHTEEMTQ